MSLRPEAPLEVKIYKTPLFQSAFGSCDVEKVYAVVPRIRYGSYGRPGIIQISKNYMSLWREVHFQIKNTKIFRFAINF